MKNLALVSLGAMMGLLVGIALSFLIAPLFQKSAPAAPAITQPPLSITLSASFVASQFQQAARQSGVGKDATMTLAAPDLARFVVPVQTNLVGVPINAKATVAMRLAAKNGRVVLAIESVDLGGIAAPRMLIDSAVEQTRAQGEDQLNRAIQNALRGSNLRVSNIRVTGDDLTVEFSNQ